jgi:hypothetical protein
VPMRIAMEVMRHSDPKLTAKIYTDAGMLPTWDAVGCLPMFNDTEIDTEELVESGQYPSASVIRSKEIAKSLTVGNEETSRVGTTVVAMGHNPEKTGPARIRTWDQGIMSPLL